MALKTPSTSLAKLSALRGREHLFQFVWGATRWAALAVTVFAAAALTDWLVDRDRDTPMWLRAMLVALELAAFAVAGYFWLLLPAVRRPRLIPLAKRVEQQIPEFDHRLVTAIQLTRRGARTEGMSPQLIGAVSEEAEQIALRHDLKQLADNSRLKWSAALVAWPLGVFFLLVILLGPDVLVALARRQALANVAIPRDVTLAAATRKNPWPAGDEVTVRYEVASRDGKLRKDMKGKVYYRNDDDNKPQDVDLVWDDKTEFSPEKAIFKAVVPQSSVSFNYRARLGDGRTDREERVEFEPRPQVTIEKVLVQAPSYIPGRPEAEMTGRAISAFNGSRARVKVSAQKPITEAKLTLYSTDDKGKQVAVGTVPMTVLEPEEAEESGKAVTVYPAVSDYFDLWLERKPRPLTTYRVSARDRNRFDSADDPRGSIRIVRPEIPIVKLLEERPPGGGMSEEDLFIRGLPAPLGGPLLVEYSFRSPVGARDKGVFVNGTLQYPAYLVYRVNDETEGGPDGPPRWSRLPLTEVPETDETGTWDALDARFKKEGAEPRAGARERVEFTAAATPRAPGQPTRTEGGGSFLFETAQLRKLGPGGELVPLDVGDHLTYFVEVYDRDPVPGRPPGESNRRAKTFVPPAEYAERLLQTLEGEEKIRKLQQRQQGLFQQPKKGKN